MTTAATTTASKLTCHLLLYLTLQIVNCLNKANIELFSFGKIIPDATFFRYSFNKSLLGGLVIVVTLRPSFINVF